jgi:hypothetical protein
MRSPVSIRVFLQPADDDLHDHDHDHHYVQLP